MNCSPMLACAGCLRQTGVPLVVFVQLAEMLRDLQHRFHLTEYFP